MRRLALCVLLCAPVAAFAQVYSYLDQSLKDHVPAGNVLLVAPDVSVSEISAGGVREKMPEWSKQARDNIAASMRRLAQHPTLHLIEMPSLNAAEQHALDQHVALYNVVAANVHVNSLSHAALWEKRLKSGLTDYTVGPGLAFLADKTGADTALVVIARDSESSGGRKAMFVLGAMFGVGLQMGQSFVIAGLIDLRTGRVLWQSFDQSVSSDLREAAGADKLVLSLFKTFPEGGKKP